MNATESDGDHPQCGQNEEIEFVVKCGAGLESHRSPEWSTRSARRCRNASGAYQR